MPHHKDSHCLLHALLPDETGLEQRPLDKLRDRTGPSAYYWAVD